MDKDNFKNIKGLVRDGYNQSNYLEVYRGSAIPTQFEKKFLDLLDEKLQPKSKILDLGCGNGVPYMRYLSDSGHTLYGVDISDKHIAQARKNVKKAKFERADFFDSSFLKEKFDAIISFYAIFHVPRDEHKKLFTRISNSLSPNGLFLFNLGATKTQYLDKNWCNSHMAWSQHEVSYYKVLLDKLGFELLESLNEKDYGSDESHVWYLYKKL